MRRVFPAIVVLGMVSCLFGASASSGGSSASGVMVRVYPDWRIDPKAYVAVTVPLEGLNVKADAVRREYARSEADEEAEASLGTRSSEAILVVMPEDQRDPAVIDLMKGLVFSQLLRQGTLTLRPGQVPPEQQKPYLFLDTAGRALPDANVAVLIGQSEYTPTVERPMVWIADAKLDAESRLLQPPRSSAGVNRFVFYVMHPDCGPAPAMAQLTGDNQPHHLFRVAALPKDQWCVFLDALGRPMSGAWVELITSGSWGLGRMTSPAPILLDEAGRLRPPPVFTTLTRCSFVVSDPNSGLALVEPYEKTLVSVREPLRTCVVPLAARGTGADAGSIWGFVVDKDGTPIPGVVIGCMKILVPGGETLGPSWPSPAQWTKEAKVLTNDGGYFAMCLPLADSEGRLGAPVPGGSEYEVTVTPPAELGYQPFQGRLAAGREHVITLAGTAYGPKQYEGTLAFRDEHGPVTDPHKISQVNLAIRSRPGSFPRMTYGYPQGEWLEKSKLPFGIYEAKVDWDGKHYAFLLVLVTPTSPEIVTLRPSKIEPFETRYRGRVIHGTNSDPIAGAVIVPASASGLDPADPDVLRRLEQQAERTARTDLNGRFEIVLPIVLRPGPEHAIIALKSDYLPYRQQRSFVAPGSGSGRPRAQEFPVDKSGVVILPDLKLFPAGVAVIEPNVPDGHRGRRVALDLLTAGDSPLWLRNLDAPPERNSGGNVIRRKELDAGSRQSVCVPAYATLALRLNLSDERYAPALVENVLIGQGKTADLGRIDFLRAMPVVVKVIDPTGGPTANVTVACLVGENDHPSFQAVTNVEGLARICVAMQSSGRFVARREDPRTKAMVCEETPYQVGGQKDAGREFVLQLSDEFPKPSTDSQ